MKPSIRVGMVLLAGAVASGCVVSVDSQGQINPFPVRTPGFLPQAQGQLAWHIEWMGVEL